MHSITLHNATYPLLITHRRTARRMVLRYNMLKQVVTLTLPKRTSVRAGLAFVESRKRWLEQQVSQSDHLLSLSPGTSFPLLGELHMAAHQPGRGLIEYGNRKVTVRGEVEFFNRRLKDWLKKRLHAEIQKLVEEKLPPNATTRPLLLRSGNITRPRNRS